MTRGAHQILAVVVFAGLLFHAGPGRGEEPAGVGLQVVGLPNGNLVVTQVVPESAAQAADIRPGDLLVAVAGKDLAGTDLATLARETLWGPPGASLSIRYLRPGIAGAFEVVLTRESLGAQPAAPAGVKMLRPQRLQEKESKP